jgi:hypothetical protein
VHLAWTGSELTMLVVIGTDCIGSCKSNYHTIRTTVAPNTIGCVYIKVCLQGQNSPSNLLQSLPMDLLQTPIWQSKHLGQTCLMGPLNIRMKLDRCLDCQIKSKCGNSDKHILLVC